MSAARSLVPQLEATLRLVRGRQWAAVLSNRAKAVNEAIDNRARYRHTSSPTADAMLMRAYAEYFDAAEKCREDLGAM